MSRCIYSLALTAIFLFSFKSAQAGTIVNDECTGAINIPTNGSSQSIAYSNFDATLSLPGCSEPANNDVWFKFTATASRHQIKATTADGTPMVLQVFKGNCANLISIICQYQQNIDLTMADVKGLTRGETYYYRVYLPGGSSQRVNFRTYIFTPATPVNDECTGAIQLAVNTDNSCSKSYSGRLGDASQSMPPCVNYGYDATDTWYKFVATATTHKITVTPTIYRDYIFEVFSGGCNGLSSLGCVNETSSNETEARVFDQLIPGNTYYIRVYNLYGWADASCTFNICINQQKSTISNDECSGAINIPTDGSTQSSIFSNIGATLSMPGCSEAADNDVWFKFKATASRHQIKATTGDGSPTVLQVFKGDCTNLTAIACQYQQNIDLTMADIKSLTPGTTYYYRVYLPGGSSQRVNLRTYIFTPATPVNDECTGAIQLAVNTDNSCSKSYSGRLGDASQSMPPCVNYGYDATDTWYKFVATATTHKITVTPTIYRDYVFEVFSGGCNGLSSLGCVNETGSNETEARVFDQLIPGNTYYIRVYNLYGWADATCTFNICINQEKNTISNDECSGAINIPTDGSTQSSIFSNIGATLSMPGCSEPADNDVWFKFKATASRHQIKATTGDGSPTVLQVFKGDCTNLTAIACQYQPQVDLTMADVKDLTPGATYYYRVYLPGGSSQRVNFRTYIFTPSTPVNDECTGAIQLYVNTDNSCGNFYEGSPGTASQSMPPCVDYGYDAVDVWYKFVAADVTHVLTLTPISFTDFIFQVYEGSCDNLASIVCTNLTGLNESESQLLTGLIPGKTYYVRVYNKYGWADNTLSYRLCISTSTPRPMLVAPGAHCAKDILRIAVTNIQPGNTVVASLNDSIPLSYDPVKQEIYGYPIPTGSNTIKVTQKNNFASSEPGEITVVTTSPVKAQGRIIVPTKICLATDYQVTVAIDENQTPLQSYVSLMKMDASGLMQEIGTRRYEGSDLSWQITGADNTTTRKYFAMIDPPSGAKCYMANNTDTVEITIEEYKAPDISQQGGILFIAETDVPASYYWQIKNGNNWEDIMEADERSYIADRTGEYRIKATTGVCTSYSNEMAINQLNKLSVFPNPSFGHITVSPLLEADHWRTLEVRSILGNNNLLQFDIKGRSQIKIDVSHLSPGSYLIILRDGKDHVKTEKFIKM